MKLIRSLEPIHPQNCDVSLKRFKPVTSVLGSLAILATVNVAFPAHAQMLNHEHNWTIVPDTVIPDTVIPDTVIPDAVIPDAVIPEKILSETVVPETEQLLSLETNEPFRSETWKLGSLVGSSIEQTHADSVPGVASAIAKNLENQVIHHVSENFVVASISTPESITVLPDSSLSSHVKHLSLSSSDASNPNSAANLSDLTAAELNTETFLAQVTPEDIQRVQSRLDVYQGTNNFGNVFQGSPAVTVANPTGYGADDNLAFVSLSFQSRTRFTQTADGGLNIGVGFGDAIQSLGVELSYAAASFGSSRSFGAGGFNIKVHRAFEGDFAIAVGWNGFITVADPFGDFKDSVYGVVTKVMRINDSINEPFSRIAFTAGLGSGQFRSERDIQNRVDSVNLFGSVAVRVVKPVSAIVEWTGQDLAIGFSYVPIQDVAWSITPAIRDITGAGDGARFVLGTSFAVKF